jgi:elongation factor G
METANTRNFALIGHGSDGKTSLGEAILHKAGATTSLGDVTQGTSVLNYLPEEKHGHSHSVTSHLFSFDYEEHHLTLVDTPGDSNFQGDGVVALQALDAAVVVISSIDGSKIGTEKMLEAAGELAAIGFINSMDKERADFDAALASLTDASSRRPIPLVIPLGTGEDFTGVVDLLRRRVITKAGEADVPEELSDEVETRRMELVEAAAECDDDLLEKYLEEGELDDDEVRRALVIGTRSRQLLPVLCGSALLEIGIESLLGSVLELLPSPQDRGEWSGTGLGDDGDITVKPEPDEILSAIVFKTIIDRYAGTLSVFRVVSGTLKADGPIMNATTGEKTRVGKLFRLQGEKHFDITSAGPGEIVAVAKVKGMHTGHVVTAEKGRVRLPSPTIPQGVLSYAITAKLQGDDDKVYASLGRLVEEDPILRLGREASTGEFLLTGMGELHIRTTVAKLARMFECEVELKTPKVPYRETITVTVEKVEGKLKKQTGGKGMYGVCYLTLEPKGRGEGFEFSDEIVGGSIPRSLIPAVEKGVLEACDGGGPLAGYPVVDVKVRCIDGKHHAVDSNEMAFKLAGSFGFRAALEKARPTLLEPIMNAEITIPDESVGDIMGDVSSRRGRVQSSESRGNATVVKARVPMAEMLEYSSILTSLTAGKGAFHMEFSHYDTVPQQVQDKIIAAAKSAASDGD